MGKSTRPGSHTRSPHTASKVKILSEQGAVTQWSADLCAQWMAVDLEAAAILYIDGHVRVYHGSQTKLPRHHVARQRLCLHATTDYWVNAMDGQPFFFINKAVDPSLIKVVENEIVPRLSNELPHQPSPEQLNDDPLLPCFTLVFDREGYSPEMMLRLKKKHVACITYHKYPGEDWSTEEFESHPVRLCSSLRWCLPYCAVAIPRQSHYGRSSSLFVPPHHPCYPSL